MHRSHHMGDELNRYALNASGQCDSLPFLTRCSGCSADRFERMHDSETGTRSIPQTHDDLVHAACRIAFSAVQQLESVGKNAIALATNALTQMKANCADAPYVFLKGTGMHRHLASRQNLSDTTGGAFKRVDVSAPCNVHM